MVRALSFILLMMSCLSSKDVVAVADLGHHAVHEHDVLNVTAHFPHHQYHHLSHSLSYSLFHKQMKSQSCSHYRYNVSYFHDKSSISMTETRNTDLNNSAHQLFYRHMCFFPYILTNGFQPENSLYNNTNDIVKATFDAHILYYCNNTTTSFYSQHYLRNQLTGKVFNPRYMLDNLLRNKTLIFYGDSTARQLFLDLEVEFLPLQTNAIDYDGKMQIFKNTSITKSEHSGLLFGMSREYANYNATLFYCQNSMIAGLERPEVLFTCNRLQQKNTLIVISAGAWYRPYSGRDDNLPEYDATLERRMQIFKERITDLRTFLLTINPHLKVVWRLIPHAGKMEEIYYKNGKLRHKSDYSHYKDLLVWDDVGVVSKWPIAFNRLILDLIESNYPDDEIFDVFTATLLYIDYSRPREYPVHADAVHYCPGGAMKASMLLLQEILEDHVIMPIMKH